MRKALTPPEARLWAVLRTLRSKGLHFRRQAPVDGYFLDFFCWDRGVIVEVDGVSHSVDARMRHDARRDAHFASKDIVTLRYSNTQVRDALEDVVEAIVTTCLARPTRSLRDHPPQGEGESTSVAP